VSFAVEGKIASQHGGGRFRAPKKLNERNFHLVFDNEEQIKQTGGTSKQGGKARRKQNEFVTTL
jgi:hypothetical protein